MSKYLSLRITEKQLQTIQYALDILGQDCNHDSPDSRRVHRDIKGVEYAIAKAIVKRDMRTDALRVADRGEK